MPNSDPVNRTNRKMVTSPKKPRRFSGYTLQLLVFLPIVFGMFHLFVFYCWYFRGIAIEFPLIIGSLVILVMSRRLRHYIPIDSRKSIDSLRPLTTTSSIVEIALWYVGMIILYVVLYAQFSFPQSLENETWRPIVLGYGLYFLGVFVSVSLFHFTIGSVKLVYKDLLRVAHVILRILSIFFLYVLVNFIFAFIYRGTSLLYPVSFNKPIDSLIDAIYFSTGWRLQHSDMAKSILWVMQPSYWYA